MGSILFLDGTLIEIIDRYIMECRGCFDDTKIKSINYNFTLQYAAEKIKLDIKKQREGAKRYEWEALSDKDKNATLFEKISNVIKSQDNIKLIEIIQLIGCIENNLFNYYQDEFNEYSQQLEIDYQHCGHFDNVMEA